MEETQTKEESLTEFKYVYDYIDKIGNHLHFIRTTLDGFCNYGLDINEIKKGLSVVQKHLMMLEEPALNLRSLKIFDSVRGGGR